MSEFRTIKQNVKREAGIIKKEDLNRKFKN